MIVGVLKEIKTEENRVCMTPAGVEIMIQNGHTVLVEKNAGKGSGFNDKAYETAGAEIVGTPKDIFNRAQNGYACQRTVAGRIRSYPQGPDYFHLPPSGSGGRVDPNSYKKRIDRYCL